MSISYLQITDKGISYAYSPPEDETKEVLKVIADKPNLAMSVTELGNLLKYYGISMSKIESLMNNGFLIILFDTEIEKEFKGY